MEKVVVIVLVSAVILGIGFSQNSYAGPGIQMENLRVEDSSGKQIPSPIRSSQFPVQIVVDISNSQDREQSFAYLVEITKDGLHVPPFGFISGSLAPGQSFSPSIQWLPIPSSGTYQIKAQLFDDVGNQNPIAPELLLDVIVVEVSNNQVSMELGDQTEPSIAVNPLDPNHIIIGAIDIPADNCRFYVSFDGGETFVTDLLDLSSGTGSFDSCTDPSVAFGPDGTMYYAGFMENGERGAQGYISRLGVWEAEVPPFGTDPHFVRTMTADGRQIECLSPPPRSATCNKDAELQIHVDKPYLTIDPRFGAIYLAWNTLNLDCMAPEPRITLM